MLLNNSKSSKRNKSQELENIFNIGNYYNRIKFYNKANKIFKKINKQQCLTPIVKNEELTEYSINNDRLILIKQIGSKSKYGLIFLTIDNKFLFKFATKLTPEDHYNNFEIKLIEFFSKVTLKDKNPHFLLSYKSFICNNLNSVLYTSPIPKLIKEAPIYNIIVNELVSGNLKDFILNKIATPELLLNAIQQVLISILSFHYFTNGLYHNDCHYKNFLFLHIDDGGYFHYTIFNQDVYVKNLGFIWMIWDFGLVKKYHADMEKRLDDYIRISRIIFQELYKMSYEYRELLLILKEIVKYKHNYKEIFGNSDNLFFTELLKINGLYETNIPSGSIIINSKPYIIK